MNVTGPALQGKLSKRGKINTSWKERWFILDEYKQTIQYYESDPNVKQMPILGTIDLKLTQKIETLFTPYSQDLLSEYIQVNKKRKSGKAFKFELVTSNRTYILAANDSQSYISWLNELDRVIYGEILYSGVLRKLGQINKSWKARFFVLNKYKQIKYYTTKKRLDFLGYIDLNNCTIIKNNNRTYSLDLEYTFEIATLNRTWTVCAPSKQEKLDWIENIELVTSQNDQPGSGSDLNTTKKHIHHQSELFQPQNIANPMGIFQDQNINKYSWSCHMDFNSNKKYYVNINNGNQISFTDQNTANNANNANTTDINPEEKKDILEGDNNNDKKDDMDPVQELEQLRIEREILKKQNAKLKDKTKYIVKQYEFEKECLKRTIKENEIEKKELMNQMGVNYNVIWEWTKNDIKWILFQKNIIKSIEKLKIGDKYTYTELKTHSKYSVTKLTLKTGKLQNLTKPKGIHRSCRRRLEFKNQNNKSIKSKIWQWTQVMISNITIFPSIVLS